MIILFDTNLTLKFINMQHSIKTLLAVLAIAVASTFTSCYSPIEEDAPEEPSSTTRSEVLIRHNVFNVSQSSYDDTRAALTDESAANLKAITVNIYDDQEEVAFSETQFRKDYASNPEEFGVIKTTLPEGIYSLVSVGYNSESTAATFVDSKHVTLPNKGLMDTWSAVENNISVSTAGSVSRDANLTLAVSRLELTSTDLPTSDASFVRLHLSAGSGVDFDPNSQNSINISSGGGMDITCTIANFINSEGKFHFERSFFIPTSPANITVSFEIRGPGENNVLRSFTIGSYEFKRGYVNHFSGPIFSAAGTFSFTATTDWTDNPVVNF